jgi:glyoxylase-like metal-dependent hydrolase (beta-lactamase superfamily II)
VQEGDEVAGFKVFDFPGHAPGLIGLWRESDRVAICSDVVYFVNSETFEELPPDKAAIPHPGWNFDTGQAKESARKLAALKPEALLAGHEEPRSGAHIPGMIERAADAA